MLPPLYHLLNITYLSRYCLSHIPLPNHVIVVVHEIYSLMQYFCLRFTCTSHMLVSFSRVTWKRSLIYKATRSTQPLVYIYCFLVCCGIKQNIQLEILLYVLVVLRIVRQTERTSAKDLRVSVVFRTFLARQLRHTFSHKYCQHIYIYFQKLKSG